ncbi:MAG: drug/metabolite exporter YedA [Thermoanaerobaculia bacterium]
MTDARASSWAIAAGLASIYLIWGSTYVAIRFAIESLPGFLMAGARFVVAGALLYAWARWRGAPRPRLVEWRWATAIGALLLTVGNGGVVWAERSVPSGLAALLIATVPLWMVVLESLSPGGRRAGPQVWIGLGLGLAGLALLFGPGALTGGGSVAPAGAVVLVAASVAWSYGSLLTRRAKLPESALLAAAMQMLAGGALLALAGTAAGEWGSFDPAAVTLRSWVSLAYLSVFGSIIAFTAYIWLLQVTSATLVSTYAFVNPVIAVLLGWALAGEALNGRIALAAAVIIAGVVVITTARGARESAHGDRPSDIATEAQRSP